ncbi:calycin-like domain-containing protein [uncultured Phocaeicola sp.]|uniref:calycin-like domain-containing protein n=1 Tax=uncultured Phocaeicola sp. TaxID=990718 RepID=UPI0025F71F38|nr:calycin-like domain-containing protein [uncultured Phocaeicola sp.]
MKKNLFFYLFALVCAMPLFTSCSDDEETPVASIEEEIAGNYGGTLEIQLFGQVISGDGIAQNVNVTKAGDNAISLSIVDFSFLGIQVGDINLSNCPLTSTGDNSYSFTAEPFELAAEDGSMTCTVTLNSGTIVDKILDLDLSINAQLGAAQQDVTVTFTGERGVTAEIASSEAQITSFSFDTSVEANAAVLTQPVIDEEAHTITFTVEKGLDITALVRTYD